MPCPQPLMMPDKAPARGGNGVTLRQQPKDDATYR